MNVAAASCPYEGCDGEEHIVVGYDEVSGAAVEFRCKTCYRYWEDLWVTR